MVSFARRGARVMVRHHVSARTPAGKEHGRTIGKAWPSVSLAPPMEPTPSHYVGGRPDTTGRPCLEDEASLARSQANGSGASYLT
jgi:hypothetical protein